MLRGEADLDLRMPVAPGPDLESVWHAFRTRLRSFVAGRVPRAADGDDIVQTVFLRLHQSLPALRDAERVHAWLYRTARRAIADHYRAPQRRREVAAGGLSELEVMAEADIPPADADDFLAFAACVAPMVETLPAAYREAIVLADLREVRVADAARAAGITLTAMKSRVRRGRQQLRRMLIECCDPETGPAAGRCASPDSRCGHSCA